MRFVFRSLVLATAVLAATSLASSQDLGSANKLFGGGKSTSPSKPTAKRTPAPKKAVPHSALAKKPPASRSSDKATARARDAKAREIVAPSGKKITRPTTEKPYDKDRFSGRKNVPEPKVSPADEARYNELIDEGDAALDERNYQKAESLFKNARSIKPKDARAAVGLGNAFSRQQRWEEAENSLRAALQLDPSNTAAQLALSNVLTQPLAVDDLSDRYAEAEKLAKRATELSPRSAEAYDQLGVAMELRGQLGQDTENAYRKAIALDQSWAPAYAHLGRFLRRRGQIEAAGEAYRQAVERSSDVPAMVIVADVMQSDQRFADSIPLLRHALEADSRNASALLNLGRALTVTGEYKDAEAALQRALTVGAQNHTANALLASLYARQGAFELAENALLRALATAPSYEHRQLAQAFVSVAQGYTRAGKSDQARRAYAKAAQLDPESGAVSGRFRP